MSAAADVMTDLSEVLDFDGTIPCEGYGHKEGRGGHDPSQRGAMLMDAPCDCSSIVLCLSRIDMLEKFRDIKCERCNKYYPRSKFRFVFIPRDSRH